MEQYGCLCVLRRFCTHYLVDCTPTSTTDVVRTEEGTVRVKTWIVIGLERACGLIDRLGLPIVRNHYACQLADWSGRLDERWGTEVWIWQ